MIKGQILSGEFGKVIMRQKSDVEIELGELLVAEHKTKKIILQVFDLMYGSQMSQSNLELISGLSMEEKNDLRLMDPHLRNYNLALLKNMLTLEGGMVKVSKDLPPFFSEVRQIEPDDIKFLTRPKKPLLLGNLRSGSKVIETDIYLEGDKVLCEHILIPATTGRGKSNLTSCMLWDMLSKDYCSALVLDPHDEYYGRTGLGLKDHPDAEKVVYYSPNPPAGANSLKINLKDIRPRHFNGVMNWSDPQKEALSAYYKKFGEAWIQSILLDRELQGFHEGTIAVVKRRLSSLLGINAKYGKLACTSIFDETSGSSTISDICNELENSRTVIIDTSSFSGAVEILIGSLVTTEIFSKYKYYKRKGTLEDKPIVSVVLEEAPRVLGKEVLEKGTNIFSSIAREGRKFRVGLIAITQLPSLIPRQILANMNTKIILGIEMAPERQAIIESASQDLSGDARNIASLDKGEAIVSSNFSKFPIPIKIPYFPDMVKKTQNAAVKEKYIKKKYTGVSI